LLATCAVQFFFFPAEDGIRDFHVTGVQTCALPISDDMKRMIVLEGGQRVYAPSESDRAVLRDKIQNAEKILSAIDTQLDIINTPGKCSGDSNRARAGRIRADLAGWAGSRDRLRARERARLV